MMNEVSINTAYGVSQSSVASNRRPLEQKEVVKEVNEVGDKRQDVATSGNAQPLATQDEKENSEQALHEAVDKMREFALNVDRNLEFKVDKDSGTMVVKVLDPDTDEVVRQIPREEALSIAKALENGLGFLLETEA